MLSSSEHTWKKSFCDNGFIRNFLYRLNCLLLASKVYSGSGPATSYSHLAPCQYISQDVTMCRSQQRRHLLITMAVFSVISYETLCIHFYVLHYSRVIYPYLSSIYLPIYPALSIFRTTIGWRRKKVYL